MVVLHAEPLIRFQAGHDAYTIGSSMQVNKQGQGASSLRLLPSVDDDDMATDWDAEFEDCAGVSAPLYRVVECVFDMPAQKFFRRQVGTGVVYCQGCNAHGWRAKGCFVFQPDILLLLVQ